MIFNSRKEDFLAVHACSSRPPSTIELRCQCVILTSIIFNLLYAIAQRPGILALSLRPLFTAVGRQAALWIIKRNRYELFELLSIRSFKVDRYRNTAHSRYCHIPAKFISARWMFNQVFMNILANAIDALEEQIVTEQHHAPSSIVQWLHKAVSLKLRFRYRNAPTLWAPS
jgi:signal transduction histidine kinase